MYVRDYDHHALYNHYFSPFVNYGSIKLVKIDPLENFQLYGMQ